MVALLLAECPLAGRRCRGPAAYAPLEGRPKMLGVFYSFVRRRPAPFSGARSQAPHATPLGFAEARAIGGRALGLGGDSV